MTNKQDDEKVQDWIKIGTETFPSKVVFYNAKDNCDLSNVKFGLFGKCVGTAVDIKIFVLKQADAFRYLNANVVSK